MSIGRMFELAFVINGTMSAGFSSAFAKAGKTMQGLDDTMKFVKNEQKRLDAAFKAGQINASTYAGTMRNLQNELKQTQAQQQSLSAAMAARKNAGEKFSNAKTSLLSTVSTTAVLAAPFYKMMQTAANFDTSMSKVKATTGATGEEFEALKAKARELGEKTQFSASQSAEAMTYLGMAGWKTEQIIAGMPGLLHLAAASGEDLATTADIVSDDLTAFKMSADQAGRMADVMAAASSNANTNVRLMGETFKYCAPVAGSLGYSLEDTSIAVGLMANAGIKGSEAGTALRATMTRLVKPPKEAAVALEALGITAVNSDGSMKPLRDTIGVLRQKFAGLSDAEKAEKAASIAGQEAMSGFLAIVNASEVDLEKLTNAIDHSDGKAAEMAKTMQDNAAGAMKRLNSAIESMSISIGSTFLPFVASSADKVASWTGSLAQLAMQYPGVTQGILGMVSAIAFLIAGYKTTKFLSDGLKVAKEAFVLLCEREAIVMNAAKTATKAWGIATRVMIGLQWAWNAAMAANPVGLVVLGIAALIGIGYLLYDNWDTLTSFMGSAWEGACSLVSSSWEGVLSFLSAGWEIFKSGISAAWDAFCNFCANLPSRIAYGVGYVLGYLSVLPGRIAAFITEAGIWLSQLPSKCMATGTAFVAATSNWLVSTYNTVVNWLSTTIAAAGIWLDQLPQNCAEAGMAFIAAAEGWAKGAYDAIVEWIVQIPSMVRAQISEAGAAISNWWGEVKAKFSEGFSAGANPGNAAAGVVDTENKADTTNAGKVVKARYTARGGIYGKGAFLTTFAEESPEAAIPLDGSTRAIGLWQQAGEMLGVKPADTSTASGGNSVTATFAPQIHIAGNADAATAQQIQQVLRDTLADFESKLAALQSQKARVSYA